MEALSLRKVAIAKVENSYEYQEILTKLHLAAKQGFFSFILNYSIPERIEVTLQNNGFYVASGGKWTKISWKL